MRYPRTILVSFIVINLAIFLILLNEIYKSSTISFQYIAGSLMRNIVPANVDKGLRPLHWQYFISYIFVGTFRGLRPAGFLTQKIRRFTHRDHQIKENLWTQKLMIM